MGELISTSSSYGKLKETLSRDVYTAVLSLGHGEWTVEALNKLPEGTQPQNTVEELIAAEDIVRADERVRKLAADVGERCEFQPIPEQ
jgi:primary-amine oxidase